MYALFSLSKIFVLVYFEPTMLTTGFVRFIEIFAFNPLFYLPFYDCTFCFISLWCIAFTSPSVALYWNGLFVGGISMSRTLTLTLLPISLSLSFQNTSLAWQTL